jgi:hypothetical protein
MLSPQRTSVKRIALRRPMLIWPLTWTKDLRTDEGVKKGVWQHPTCPSRKPFIIINIVGQPKSGHLSKRTNLCFFCKLEARTAKREGGRRFPGSHTNLSHLFAIISRQLRKAFVFIDITGWAAKCLKRLRVFNNITGWTFIFHARVLRIDH